MSSLSLAPQLSFKMIGKYNVFYEGELPTCTLMYIEMAGNQCKFAVQVYWYKWHNHHKNPLNNSIYYKFVFRVICVRGFQINC